MSCSTDVSDEKPEPGEPCGCGGEADVVCWMPVYNGVFVQAQREPMCEPCAMELAEAVGEYWRAKEPA